MYIKSITKTLSLSSLLILYLSSISSAQNGCDLVCIAGGTEDCNPLISNCPPCVGQRGDEWYCSEPKSEGQCEELDFTFCQRENESINAPTNAPTTTSKRTPTPTTTKRTSLRPTVTPSSDSSSNDDVNSPNEGDSSSSSSNSSTQKPSTSSSGSGSNSEVVNVPKTTKKKTTVTPPPLDISDTSDTSIIENPTTISPSPTADDTKITTESESSSISTPIIVGFIGAGVVLFVGFALCCWKLQQDGEESEDEEDHQWNNNPQVMSAQKITPLQYKQQQLAEDQPYGNFHSQSDGSGYSVDPYSEKFSGYYTGPVASQSPVPAAPATIASDYGYHSNTSDISADNNTVAPYSSQRYQRSRSGFNQQKMRAPSNISVEF